MPHSRSALASVVVAHVAAALLLVQILEARRYIEPAPLKVTLLPEIREAAPAPRPDPVPVPVPPRLQPPAPLPTMPEPVREVRPEPVPVREPEVEPIVEPEPVPEPLPPIRQETMPVVREILPEPPAPIPKPEPVRTAIAEPVLQRVMDVPPKPLPPPVEAPSRAITEVAPPPVQPAAPPAPPVVQPRALPVDAPPPPPVPAARPAPPAPPAAAQAEPDDVVMDSRVLTAVYLSNPKPVYPNVSRRLGEQGTVMLRVFVTIGGEPAQIELKSSSGYPRLDRAALNAVRSWKFSPATRGDRAVDAWVLVPIRFSLKG